MLSMSLGQGELVYSAAPVAFARFHRGRSSEALLVAIINYLLPNGRAPRLLYTEPANTAPPGSGPRFVVPESERDHDDEPPPALGPPPLAVPRAGRLPDGFELLDCVAEEPYDVLAQAAAGSGAGTQPTIVLLDGRFDDGGKALRPALWLTLTPRRIELRSGKDPSAKPVAAVDWQAPDTPAPLLIRRRPGLVSVVAGATEVLHVRASSAPGGAVAVCAGGVTLSDPVCQPVAPAVFDDDFMREAGPATLWTPVSGTWTNVGVGDEEYSINGFYYLGRSDQTALATAGDWFWEDYSLSAAVRPNAAGTQVGRTVRSTVSPPSAKAGDAQVGLCALVQDNGDYLAFVADPASAASPKLRLTRTLSGAQTVLAETDGGLTPGQWYRLGLRLHDGTLEALLDGETVLTCPDPEVRGGGVGLLVSGGSARFDDVVVRPNSEAIRVPRDEGSPVAELPPSLGPHDTLTWGSPATPWEADPEHPSILWHDGFFPGDFDLSLKVRPASEPALRRLILAPAFSSPENQRLTVALSLAGGSSKAEIAWQKPGGKPAVKRVTLRDQAVLQLSRHAGKLTVLWCGQAVCQADARRHTRLALEVFGPPVRAKDLTVRSAGAHDYVFGAAPTDWWISSGVWEVSARWACDDRWSWLAGWATGDAAIWNKRRFDGDVAVDCYVGVKMNAPGGPETARCRDYNLVLCGDRQDPRSGYSFILGGDGGVKTQLLKNGQVVAEAPTIRVPAGYNVHHCWFRVRASRIGNVISYDFERRPVFRYEDPDPLPGGYVGLWTRNSGIMIPRVTIWSCPDRG